MQILLADHEATDRSALRRLLEREPELKVVGEAAGAEELLAQLQEKRPDLVLLNWELSGRQGTVLVSLLHALYGPLKVIAFGKGREVQQEALAAGADAFVSREEPLEWLLTTLRRVGGLSRCLVG